jgi:hypothetical protein
LTDALFAEPGSTWWPAAWGPGFALVGALVEALSGPVHVLAWIVVAVVLGAIFALWVTARRRTCAVRVTPDELVQGGERLPVASLASVEPDDTEGGRVLGGGFAVPRKFTGVPLRLVDGKVVVAWARDGDGLRAALESVIGSAPDVRG